MDDDEENEQEQNEDQRDDSEQLNTNYNTIEARTQDQLRSGEQQTNEHSRTQTAASNPEYMIQMDGKSELVPLNDDDKQ